MTRKLLASDLEVIFGLVSREPSLNIWVIADLENYTFPSDSLEMWGDFRSGELRSVLFRFYDNHVVYSPDRRLPEELVAVLRELRPMVLSGEAATVHSVSSSLGLQTDTPRFLAELGRGAFRPHPGPSANVQTATALQAEEFHELSQTVSEFSSDGIDAWIRRLNSRNMRTYYIRQAGRIVSAASTTIECSTSAMIGEVMTHPDYRGRGLASACVSRLCADIVGSGKVCCLIYHDLQAGRIYERLGFRVVAPWAFARRSSRNTHGGPP